MNEVNEVMNENLNGGNEMKEVKEAKAPKKPSTTNILIGITAEHVAKFKEGTKSRRIAELLADENSKSEILKLLKTEELESGLAEGEKTITHQAIYQVYNRLKTMEGVTLGQKELVVFRQAPKKADKVAKVEVEAPVSATEEFAEVADTDPVGAPEVVEG